MNQQTEPRALPAPKHDTHAQNAIERQGLDGTSIERQTTAAMVQAEKARAMVQARIMQAVARPRDFYVVRDRILGACKRPAFAAVGLYRKPVGKKNGQQQYAVGPSVRFAEEALRSMGNMLCEQTIVYEDARVRTIKVEAIDLETNASASAEITIEKTVERREAKNGQVVIGRRVNSYGDTVYIVEASEDEFAVKAAANIAKARRQAILQLVPGDLVDEAKAQIESTVEAGANAVDPATARKRLIDWYAKELGINPVQIAEFLGHSVDTATRQEMKDLQAIGNAIVEKETTWAEVMEARKAGPDDTATEEKRAAAGQKVVDSIATPAAPAAGAVRAPADVAAERRATEPTKSVDAQLEASISDEIADADGADGINRAKARLDGARGKLTDYQWGKLHDRLLKRATKLGVKV